VVRSGIRADHIWWVANDVLYWVSNTIFFDVEEEELLKMAVSAKALN